MSFHFKIKKKQNISFKQLLENKYLPENTNISFEANFNELLNGYSKLYISKLSSRGVAITTTQNEFDVEVNVGATKEDWRLAVKISLALGELNDSLINPEFDDEKTLEQFENEYNEAWVESVKYHSMNTIIQMFKEDKTRGGAMTFMGCIRHFYVGNYVIDTLSKDNESEELLYDRLIEEIRKIQFIEDYEDEIEFPSTRIMDFPEGEKKIAIFPANFKVLLPKVDYVFLMKKNEAIVQVAYDDFIKYISTQSKRVDELQYIIYAVDESKHYNMLLHFKSLEDKKNELPTNKIEKIGTKKWWKFWK